MDQTGSGVVMTEERLKSGQGKDVFHDLAMWGVGTDEEPLVRVATILLVEDEAFVREVTFEVLQSAGYRVLTARNAAEAMRIYDEIRADVDLLLTDVILRGETGFALAAKIRGENPELSVLFVTGYAEQMAMACEKEGEECLAKPFSSEGLLRRVRDLLDRPGVRSGRESQPMPAFANA